MISTPKGITYRFIPRTKKQQPFLYIGRVTASFSTVEYILLKAQT